MSTKLVFDTSALISLSLAETLHLVDKLGFEVLVPPTVFSELKETSAYDDDVAIATRRALSFVKECVLGLDERSREFADRLSRMPKLDRGEAEALAVGVLDALAVARGWKQSVIYGTAILMMEKAREAKGEK